MRIFNRRARYDYNLLEKFEAGIALSGAEVKSVKAGHIRLEEAFVQIKNGQAWLVNAHIHPYPFADNRNYDSRRTRKLLLHKNELLKLAQQTSRQSLTIVPISCYTKNRNIKLEMALAKGKKKYEKREAIKKRDIEREIREKLKIRN
ncbi:SsrA-binding protein [Candidatus Shapirobacteria bacterium CG_4_9_14_0_2_um_filter_39_11]|uniref:SsrA-binding protein n=1 Tax=Candidatus Shapirobacteria bacterium CG_4_9_14_0_2_um_filter_39_11 TaxID=1974478 RepID=A0A2M8ES25_9BACT|nr:MAG: SsrA-binding protein [Candidatus Shapirobacteria bacterium CG_4_9_14_0_2_um_filter_39_11]